MRKKTYEEIKHYIEVETNSGCKLLTPKEEYIDTHQKILCQCQCGNIFETEYHRVVTKNKVYCNECGFKITAEKTKNDGNVVYNAFINSELMPMFKPEDYKNSKQKLPYICKNKPEVGIQFISYSNFCSGRRCKCCKGERTSKKQRININTVYDEFIKRDLVPKFSEEDYKNAQTKLPYICIKHPDEVQYTTYASVRDSMFCCKLCVDEYMGSKKRKDGEDVIKVFKEHGMIPLFQPEDYINNSDLLPCICEKHKEDGIIYRSYAKVRSSQGCVKCAYEKITGENHYAWAGGISPVHNHFRDKINQWKNDSLKYYGYKCDITNTRDNLVVHHLYPYCKILSETLEELKLPVYSVINQYSQEELDLIAAKLLENHYKHGYGVPLSQSIHEKFHSEYGRGDTTPEQYNEFKSNYKNE